MRKVKSQRKFYEKVTFERKIFERDWIKVNIHSWRVFILWANWDFWWISRFFWWFCRLFQKSCVIFRNLWRISGYFCQSFDSFLKIYVRFFTLFDQFLKKFRQILPIFDTFLIDFEIARNIRILCPRGEFSIKFGILNLRTTGCLGIVIFAEKSWCWSTTRDFF